MSTEDTFSLLAKICQAMEGRVDVLWYFYCSPKELASSKNGSQDVFHSHIIHRAS